MKNLMNVELVVEKRGYNPDDEKDNFLAITREDIEKQFDSFVRENEAASAEMDEAEKMTMASLVREASTLRMQALTSIESI